MKDSKLELAKAKYRRSKQIDINQDIIDYICECYVKLNPCSYGARIQNFICKLLGLKTISSRLNCGDFIYKNTYGEFKVTYLDQTKVYHITHIRPWQKFKYYLIMFIDCENNFTPEFYFLPKNTLNKFKLTSMVGTKESNEDNHNVDLRTSIKKGSAEHKTISKNNLLKGTTIEDLKEFIWDNMDMEEKNNSPLRHSMEILPNTNIKNKKTLKIFVGDKEIQGNNIIDRIIKMGDLLSDKYDREVLLEKLPTYFKSIRTDLPTSMVDGNRNHFVLLGNNLYFTTWGNVEQKKSMIDNICKKLNINNIKCIID